MSHFLRNIIRFVMFLAVQAFVLDKVPSIHQFVKPYLYFLFILWLPFTTQRWWLLLTAFIFGLCMDYLNGKPGWHAAPCVLIAYIRPFLLNILIPQETTELTFAEPSITSMGWAPYAVYVFILTFVHHTYLVLIQWIQFGDFLFFLGKVAGTTALSLVLIFIVEMIFTRKGKLRTNVA